MNNKQAKQLIKDSINAIMGFEVNYKIDSYLVVGVKQGLISSKDAANKIIEEYTSICTNTMGF
jgi:hypothetical protein